MKLILTKPLPMTDLLDKLRELGCNVTPDQRTWLELHGCHEGLVLERKRFYCRTCKTTLP
jgi:hypothetical protein